LSGRSAVVLSNPPEFDSGALTISGGTLAVSEALVVGGGSGKGAFTIENVHVTAGGCSAHFWHFW